LIFAWARQNEEKHTTTQEHKDTLSVGESAIPAFSRENGAIDEQQTHKQPI